MRRVRARPSRSRTARSAAARRSSSSRRPTTLSLEYEIKDRTLVTPVVDLLFVRRVWNDALRRTVTRFSNERKAEIQFG
jgi:hypothetical protein